MNKIMLNTIKPGAIFSKPLYLNDGENLFLPANTPITENELELLQNKAILELYTNGKEITADEIVDVDADNLDDELSSAFAVAGYYTASRSGETEQIQQPDITEESQAFDFLTSIKNTESYTSYLLLVKNCQRIFDSVKARERLSEKPVTKAVSDLIMLVEEHPELCVALILENDIHGYEMGKPAIDVASLSYLVAKYMMLSKEKVREITIAAILHDVGMLMVNEDIVEKTEKLNAAEMQAIESHTVYGYKCLVNEFMYSDKVAKIVLQHHEWFDGSGYPSRLVKDEIDIGARILACADAFVAMTSKKSYRKALLGYEAMKALLNDNSTHFDPRVVNALIRSIGIFPIGSIVMLSDSSLCRVIKSVPDFPLRPQLRLLVDEHGNIHSDNENKKVNLQIQKNLFITKAIDPEMIQLN